MLLSFELSEWCLQDLLFFCAFLESCKRRVSKTVVVIQFSM